MTQKVIFIWYKFKQKKTLTEVRVFCNIIGEIFLLVIPHI